MLKWLGVAICSLCFLPLIWLLVAWLVPMSEDTQRIWNHTVDVVLSGYALGSLTLALGAALVAMGVGAGCAWLVSLYRFPGRKFFMWALVLPLAVPAYISAYAYGTLTDTASPLSFADYLPSVRNMPGAIMLVGIASMPYVYLLARTAFSTQPSSWREVSQSLGYSNMSYFWRVALPAARPFWAMGATLVVMEAVADIGAVSILGVSTLATGVYRSWFYLGEPLVAARLSFLLLAGVIAIVLFERFERQQTRYISYSKSDKFFVTLRGAHAWLASIACALPLLIGFVVPVLYLVWLNYYRMDALDWQRIMSFAVDSLHIAVWVGLVSVLIALLLHFSERISGGMHRFAHLLAYAGYAIPGVAVAVSIMLASQFLQHHTQGAILITGTFFGVCMACVIRFLATAMGSVHAGYERIPRSLDMAALSLGASSLTLLWRVHLPLLRLPLCVAFLVVVVDTLKELPATLILRPFDVKTLAIATYEFASDDRAMEASPYALALIALTSACMLLIYTLQNRMMKHHV